MIPYEDETRFEMILPRALSRAERIRI